MSIYNSMVVILFFFFFLTFRNHPFLSCRNIALPLEEVRSCGCQEGEVLQKAMAVILLCRGDESD